MEPNTTYAISLEDMIFEGRNKAYGAYVLRKLYHQHLSQALLYAIAFFLLLFSVPVMLNAIADKAVIDGPSQKTDPGTWVDVIYPPIEEVIPPKAAKAASAQPETKTVQNTTPKVVDNATPVKNEVPNQDELKNANSGLVTSEGTGGTDIGNPLAGEGTRIGTGTGSGNGETNAAPTEIFYSAEHMPEFVGGMKGLAGFLSKNLRYPNAAKAQGIEGTVVLSFVVAATGEITDIQVLKGLGYGTEEEAIRVVGKMPRWKPGSQNGRTVPVRMTLPIRLEIR